MAHLLLRAVALVCILIVCGASTVTAQVDESIVDSSNTFTNKDYDQIVQEINDLSLNSKTATAAGYFEDDFHGQGKLLITEDNDYIWQTDKLRWTPEGVPYYEHYQIPSIPDYDVLQSWGLQRTWAEPAQDEVYGVGFKGSLGLRPGSLVTTPGTNTVYIVTAECMTPTLRAISFDLLDQLYPFWIHELYYCPIEYFTQYVVGDDWDELLYPDGTVLYNINQTFGYRFAVVQDGLTMLTPDPYTGLEENRISLTSCHVVTRFRNEPGPFLVRWNPELTDPTLEESCPINLQVTGMDIDPADDRFVVTVIVESNRLSARPYSLDVIVLSEEGIQSQVRYIPEVSEGVSIWELPFEPLEPGYYTVIVDLLPGTNKDTVSTDNDFWLSSDISAPCAERDLPDLTVASLLGHTTYGFRIHVKNMGVGSSIGLTNIAYTVEDLGEFENQHDPKTDGRVKKTAGSIVFTGSQLLKPLGPGEEWLGEPVVMHLTAGNIYRVRAVIDPAGDQPETNATNNLGWTFLIPGPQLR